MQFEIPRQGRFAIVSLVLVALFFVVLTNPKLIWTDEFLQFAFGAYSNTLEALNAISLSTQGINHGQTGFQMFLNHLFLKAFGASYFVLRFPSAFSSVLGLYAGYALLSNMGVSFFSRILFLLGVGLSQLNIEHGGEARPYIFLEAAVLGFLWAWERFLSGRRFRITLITLMSALGILGHPFFVAYAGLSVVLTPIFFPVYRARLIEDLKAKSQLFALIFSTCSLALLFLLVGKFSWFQTMGHKFQLDPFFYIGRDKSLIRFMLGTFFFPFGKVVVPFSVLLLFLVVWWRKSPGVRELLPWLSFFVMLMVVTQTILVWQVLRSDYWLLQRQWIAGSALAILAVIILVEIVVVKIGPKISINGAPTLILVLVAMLGMLGLVKKNSSVEFPPVVPIERAFDYRDNLSRKKEIELQEFLYLAHLNLLAGGSVWPIFRRFYEPNFGR